MLVGYTPRYDPADCKFKGLLLGRDPHDVMRDVLVHINICYTDELSLQRVDKKQIVKLLEEFIQTQAERLSLVNKTLADKNALVGYKHYRERHELRHNLVLIAVLRKDLLLIHKRRKTVLEAVLGIYHPCEWIDNLRRRLEWAVRNPDAEIRMMMNKPM